MILLLAMVLAQTVPSAEAEALGVRAAQTGTLAALLPSIAGKERDDLLAAHADWSDADKASLRETADGVARAALDRLTAAIGHGYATRLSVEDLRALVAFNESDAGRHWRAATPGAVMEAIAAVGQLNLGADTRAAFCKKAGKLCEQ
jgi:hypothetical protein